jgi:hypothetical protein
VKCQQCEATAGGSKWANVRAHDAGWFEMRDGRAWCPRHVPEWVQGWRQQQEMPDLDLAAPPCELAE